MNEREKQHFVDFLKKIREELPKNIKLTISTNPSKKLLNFLDLPEIDPCIDYINIMTYGFYGPYSHITGYNSPALNYTEDYIYIIKKAQLLAPLMQ